MTNLCATITNVCTNVDECAYARLRGPSSRFAFVHRQDSKALRVYKYIDVL